MAKNDRHEAFFIDKDCMMQSCGGKTLAEQIKNYLGALDCHSIKYDYSIVEDRRSSEDFANWRNDPTLS